ncbi:MAG: polysaccharide biosynthesis/export family protein [Phycisphaeraceae bacterium]
MSQSSSYRMQNMARRGLLGCMALFMGIMGGCEVDSYLDPSVVGRWEYTPVVLPILDRLDVIDEPEDNVPGLSEIRSEDLVPEVREYVMGPGDTIRINIFELVTPGTEAQYIRRIDELGNVRLPHGIGQVRAQGQTARQFEDRLADILDPDILRDPEVTTIVEEGRQKTFSILGVAGSGTYPIIQNNFRLLDALSLAQGVPDTVDRLYVIRQVPLSDIVESGYQVDVERPDHVPPPPRSDAPDGEGEAEEDDLDPGALIEGLTQGLEEEAPQQDPAAQRPAAEPEEGRQATPLDEAITRGEADGRFINVNGEWVWVEGEQPNMDDLEGDWDQMDRLPPPDQLVTQRVIEIDAKALMRGEAKENIVVRPGDVVRVPPPVAGNVYIGGAIARPGTYGLPGERKLTLTQLVISAGGLDPVAIPERVDITRRLGPGQEATVRLNLRAIFEGNQPNLYMKPDDTVNVGTNIIAPFLAVTRNAFRMSYGFGFLLDRNFGTDVFGPVQNQGFGGGF